MSRLESPLEPDAERKLAAILSADVVGYSRHVAEDEVGTVRRLTAYRDEVDLLVTQHRGRVVDAPGDNLLAEFPSATEAVRCAVAVQRVVEARNADVATERRLEYRIGIHLGEVMVKGERIYGDGVNIAARLEGLADAGGVCVSAAVRDQVHAKVALEFEDLGDQSMKNIPHPVRAYRARWRAAHETAPGPPTSELGDLAQRRDIAVFIVPAVWVAYVAIVLEILFMISPFALYYYSAYGPSLNFLHGSATTSWLTDFFLPHFSDTTSPLLNAIPTVGRTLLVSGVLLFMVGFVQVYWAKLRSSEAVVGGLYRWVRHPQYLALAVTGLGTLLVWPRLLVLVTYVSMLFLYTFLARVEEQQCLKKYGDAYRAYMERTGMFLPGRLFRGRPRPSAGGSGRRSATALAIYAAVLGVAIASAYGLRDWSLGHVSALYTDDLAVLSPAQLSPEELATALGIAQQHAEVRAALQARPGGPLLVYVVPVGWELQDIPMHTERVHAGHHMPRDFDRRFYRVLFTRARVHDASVAGEEIVKRAYGRDPIIQVVVNSEAGAVTAVETTPETVFWGDIPTPLF